MHDRRGCAEIPRRDCLLGGETAPVPVADCSAVVPEALPRTTLDRPRRAVIRANGGATAAPARQSGTRLERHVLHAEMPFQAAARARGP
jgi:hypothetical protein